MADVVVVGLAGPGPLPPAAAAALSRAGLVAGARRHLDRLGRRAPQARQLAIGGDLSSALEEIATHPGPVCVLASGDPGFFGIVRALGARLGPGRLEVHPAPSSVALAFARLGLAWDDALVVSAHGRPLADAVRLAAGSPKVAVLVSPEHPPERLGQALLDTGARHSRAAVCSRLGEPDEQVSVVDLGRLAKGSWDPLSVVVLMEDLAGDRAVSTASLAWGLPAFASPPQVTWGLPDDAFAHRAGMVTKAEVRAIVLGKLDLPSNGVLWDVGAGSASVAIECARLQPGLRVLAVERRPDDVVRARANAAAHRVGIEVVAGEAPDILSSLPEPDRVFLGGGGRPALDASLARLRPGGRVVASFAALDRAAEAAGVLGCLVQVALARGSRLPDGGLRLAAENPVFVVWGPEG